MSESNPDRVLAKRPPRAHVAAQRVRNDAGANYGGPCLGCGRGLDYWFAYQLCDACLKPGRAGLSVTR